MDENLGWIIAGGATIAATWRYISGWAGWAARSMIIRYDMTGPAAEALLARLHREGKVSRFFHWSMGSHISYSRSKGRLLHRPSFDLTSSKGLIWLGRYPVWVDETKKEGSADAPQQVGHGQVGGANLGARLQVSAIRGTVDLSRMFQEATETLSSLAVRKIGRYRIVTSRGSAGDNRAREASLRAISPGEGGTLRGLSSDELRHSDILPIGWDVDDVAPIKVSGPYVVPAALQSAWNRAERWYLGRGWFEERGLPWQMGLLLHGPPGTGKSSFARKIAECMDLPVHVMDLGTLRDDELQRAWELAQANAPAMILTEDIGSVFSGTESLSKNEGAVSLDSLLNCIDGIERKYGLMIVMTTNHADRLAPALIRPGRIDVSVHVPGLTPQEARAIAERILSGLPHLVEEVMESTRQQEFVVPADFQEACIQLALRHWEESGGVEVKRT